MTYEFKIDEIRITTAIRSRMQVEIECDRGDILGEFTIEDIIEHYGFEDLLDAMDETQVRERIGISD